MTIETVRLQIPFESLVNAIASLGLEEKRKLWQVLDEQIAEAEDNDLEENATALSVRSRSAAAFSRSRGQNPNNPSIQK
jgi:hypothetical protein